MRWLSQSRGPTFLARLERKPACRLEVCCRMAAGSAGAGRVPVLLAQRLPLLQPALKKIRVRGRVLGVL